MKKLLLIFTAFILALNLNVDAQTSRETRNLRTFNAVKVSNAIKAELVQGDRNSIEIEVSGIDMDLVETEIVDKTLEIKLGKGNFRNQTVKVIVTYREILGVEATTSASVVVRSPIESEESYVFATTSAYIEAEFITDILNVEAATNARIYIEGKADEVNLKAFTNSEVDGKKFQAQNLEVQANTAATAHFKVAESINGSLATAAKLFYEGNPAKINIKTNTGARINKK
jgi:hypothetical protein